MTTSLVLAALILLNVAPAQSASSSTGGFHHVTLGSSAVRANVELPQASHSATIFRIPGSSYQAQIRNKLRQFFGAGRGSVDTLAGIITVAGYAVNITAGKNQHFALSIDTGR